MTARDIIRRSLRLIGAIKPGEPVDADETQDALLALQAMLDTWASERLTLSVIEEVQIDSVANQLSYTIGVGGDFNRVRPVWILGVSCVDPANAAQPAEYPVKQLTYEQWQGIPQKDVGSRLFTMSYYRSDYPLGRLFIWPFVNVNDIGIKLYLPTAITGFADLSTQYAFPPGYEEAIVYNLCLRLGPEWGLPVPSEVVEGANRFLANVKRTNIPMEQLTLDSGLLWSKDGLYNWRTDQSVGGR